MGKNTKIFSFTIFRKKTLIGAKLFRIRFYKIYGFIRVYDKTRYLVLFVAEEHDFIYSKIRYLRGEKGSIVYNISQKYPKIRVDLYDSLQK